jgi:methionine-rich copper-binding protein CopC
LLILGALLGSVGCAPVQLIRPYLVAAWPAPGAKVSGPPDTLELTFNRALEPANVWASVTRTSDEHTPATQLEVQPGPENAELDNLLVVRLEEKIYPDTYSVHWRAMSGGSQSVIDGEYTFEVLPEGGASAHLSVSPPDAQPNDVVQVTGRGFGKNQDVHLTIGDDAASLNTVHSDQSGRFTADSRIPTGVVSGLQPIEAVDAGGARAQAALQVRWGGWPPLVAWTELRPGPDSNDVSMTISLRNRSDYYLEAVRVVVADPPGASVVTADAGATHANDALSWDLGSVDRGTAGPLHATYRADRPITAHARVEFRHRRPHNCTGDDCLSAFVSETNSESTTVAPLIEN